MVTILFIYRLDNMHLVAQITGRDNDACEASARKYNFDVDGFGWTYTPGFGLSDGVLPSENFMEIAV